MLNALYNPALTAGFLAQTPQNLGETYDALQEGDYGSALWNGLESYWDYLKKFS
jgi:hypothetical protein